MIYMIMKNIRYILMTVLAAFFVTSCDWFVLDNMDDYDATVCGRLIDSETGENVLSEISSQTGSFKIIELGWDGEATQSWNVKNNGTYRNNLVWSGDYRMESNDANYYPIVTNFQLKKGDNEVDFYVTPYVRVLDHTIAYNATTKKIEATCTVQVTDQVKTNSLEVRLCAFTDNFVGSAFNNCKNDAGSYVKNVEFDKDGKATVKVAIDTQDSGNSVQFKYDRVHYVRLAALATGTNVNTGARYNFGPTYSLRLDGSEPVVYNEW